MVFRASPIGKRVTSTAGTAVPPPTSTTKLSPHRDLTSIPASASTTRNGSSGGVLGSNEIRDFTVTLNIWDTAGEEAYKAMTRFFFRDASAGNYIRNITAAFTH